jgi:hypothetical protein
MSEKDLELHMKMTVDLLKRLIVEGAGIDEIILRLIAL